MTKKHYIAIAKTIADEVEMAIGRANANRFATLSDPRGISEMASAVGAGNSAARIARDLAELFKRENRAFDRDRFYFACALDEDGRVDWPHRRGA